MLVIDRDSNERRDPLGVSNAERPWNEANTEDVGRGCGDSIDIEQFRSREWAGYGGGSI